ncbi:DUF4097 domain-containing protein [bacterium LRH843]|nr:DUF4097 domain-containing protein [bacterium LRH843]
MDERKMILKMIEDGKITAEEGIKLLEAMGMNEQANRNEEKKTSTELSTSVNWDEGEGYRKRAGQTTHSSNPFTMFIESTIQKIKEVDLDFNFGASIIVDHIFQHRDISPASLDLSLENGSITFKVWDEADVRVECSAKVYRVKDQDEARKTFLQESVFRVDGSKLLFHTKSKSMKVQATVYVPRTTFSHIKMYTFNGQITGELIDADTLDANALNGALIFSSVKAKKAMAETVNGAIEFEQSQIDLLDVKTINGGITLAGYIQDVDAETVNGSITYELSELPESGYADLKATTGSVHLFVPKSIRIEGKLKTNVGGFTIDMADHEVLEEKKEFVQKSMTIIGNQHSSPRVKVNAVTNTGSVLVKDQV